MTLDLINMKIMKTKFTHLGCGNLTEYADIKKLFNEIYTISMTGKLVTIKLLTRMITKAGKNFSKNAEDILAQDELYNQFVGDAFELFAEYFFKTCSTVGQYGIVNYQVANNPNDWGVDGYGIAADQRKISGGATPAVVQVKFRSNPMDEISYTMLAKTGWDGVKNYNLDIKRDNNVILFCNTENGANHLAINAMGNNLYVISMKDLDKDVTGIRTTTFWDNFLALL